MAKTYQKLELLTRDRNPKLSILESRKNNQANLCLAEENANVNIRQRQVK